jgi:hypothetical protein
MLCKGGDMRKHMLKVGGMLFVLGVSGRHILVVLVAGERDADIMVELAKGRLHNKIAELQKVLTGVVDDHHRFLLVQHWPTLTFSMRKWLSWKWRIARHPELMSQTPPATPPQMKRNNPSFLGTRLLPYSIVHLVSTPVLLKPSWLKSA